MSRWGSIICLVRDMIHIQRTKFGENLLDSASTMALSTGFSFPKMDLKCRLDHRSKREVSIETSVHPSKQIILESHETRGQFLLQRIGVSIHPGVSVLGHRTGLIESKLSV